jgi:hypothetical protein
VASRTLGLEVSSGKSMLLHTCASRGSTSEAATPPHAGAPCVMCLRGSEAGLCAMRHPGVPPGRRPPRRPRRSRAHSVQCGRSVGEKKGTRVTRCTPRVRAQSEGGGASLVDRAMMMAHDAAWERSGRAHTHWCARSLSSVVPSVPTAGCRRRVVPDHSRWCPPAAPPPTTRPHRMQASAAPRAACTWLHVGHVCVCTSRRLMGDGGACGLGCRSHVCTCAHRRHMQAVDWVQTQ